MTNQMSRDEALDFLSESPYPDKQQLKNDYDFVIKKLGYTDIEFQEYIVRPGVSHNVFSNSVWLWELLKKLHKFVTKK
jgi:hypothetical protein